MSAAPRHLAGLLLAALVLALALQLALVPVAAPVSQPEPALPGGYRPPPAGVHDLARGFGVVGDYWSVYFSAPPALRRSGDRPDGSHDAPGDTGGIDGPLAAAMDAARVSLDVAAFELNNPLLTEAMLAAAARGLRVRVVTDDEHGLRNEDSSLGQLQAAGIPVVADDRSALMHNKFVVVDGALLASPLAGQASVWSGSMNLTVNGSGRHNNNLLQLRSAEATRRYQAEFDEMFTQGLFGPRSPQGATAPFTADGLPSQTGKGRIAIYFGPEDDLAMALDAALAGARESIRFMAFSFTLDELGATLLRQATAGVTVQGIFERTGSETVWSELGPLYCAGLAGLAVRQDGNPWLLHHKVFLIDDHTVVTGSANFSGNGTDANDENLLVIDDPALAAPYAAEFARRWDEAGTPQGLACS